MMPNDLFFQMIKKILGILIATIIGLLAVIGVFFLYIVFWLIAHGIWNV